MCKAGLWILKGDLNYRKAVYDLNWPSTTTLQVALGGLVNGKGRKTPPVLLLRTCKSDPAVGLEEGKERELDGVDGEWRVNGKWGEFCEVSSRFSHVNGRIVCADHFFLCSSPALQA